ncbi:MAG: flippase-like domain-containing protein [Actinomycetota bacterium]|nr:flippase-like domain-containing protein [Actinomycetota bacterium]
MVAESSVADGSSHLKASWASRLAVLVRVARILVFLAIAGSITYAIYTLWPDVRDTWLALNPWAIALSVAAALTAMTANVMAWHAVLRELDHRVPVIDAGRITLVGQLGKYLPGSIWAFVLQMELARRAGIPRARAFAASLILVGIATTAALVLGLMGLPALREVGGAAVWGVLALIPVAVVCAMPPVLSRLVNLFLRLLRREGLGHGLTYRGLSRIFGWSLVAWVLFGVHFWVLSSGLEGAGAPNLAEAIGAFALGMTAGLLAVASPSGLGVREAVLVALLAPFAGLGAALGVALASRLILTVADVLAASVAVVSARLTGTDSAAGAPVGREPVPMQL